MNTQRGCDPSAADFVDMSDRDLFFWKEKLSQEVTDIQRQLESYNEGFGGELQTEEWRYRAVKAWNVKRDRLKAAKAEIHDRHMAAASQPADEKLKLSRDRYKAFVRIACEEHGDEWAQETWKKAAKANPNLFQNEPYNSVDAEPLGTV